MLDLIAGDKKLNEIMETADMRESHKFYVLGNRYEIKFKGKLESIANIVDAMRKASESEGSIVIFCGIAVINDVKPKEPIYYLKRNVSLISDGKKVGMLRDILQSLGYTVEVDEHNRVVKLL